MLEEYVPSGTVVLRCFINGTYYYNARHSFRVELLRNFLDFFRSCSREKKNIVVGNLQTRLDAVKRYAAKFDDDIPF
jgi:hypothetical protein